MTARRLLSLAWRESRFARKRLFLFLSAISLGVAALVAVQGFASNLQREVQNQARAMLGADVRLMSREPFRDRTEAVLDSATASGVEIARVTSFASMALNPRTGATRLVQVRAPEPRFPFYGQIDTDPAERWADLHDGRNIIVDPSLLVAVDAEIGDSLSIGAARFRIIGALRKLPGDVEVASSFAPRVFFPAAALDETELLGFGARVEYEAFLRIPDPAAAEAFVEENRPIWRADRVRARTIEEQQERMENALTNLSDFLGMVGVFALLLGGIGVASAMGAYMARKADGVAVLRCLGATSRQVFGIYLVQAAVMGLAGAAVGVVLGSGVQWVLPRLLAGLLPVDVQIRLDGIAILTGVIVGVWTAVVFALLPLLQVRRVSPLTALRRQVEPIHTGGPDRLRGLAWVLLSSSVFLLVMYQAGRLVVGINVTLGIAGTLLVLWLAAHGVTRLLRRMPRSGLVYPLRQGLANLYRPGNQTVTVVLALGFGVFLIATLLLTQTNILRTLSIDADSRGNLLLIDVQQDQVADVEAILASRAARIVQSAAIVPMRIAAVDGVPVQHDVDSPPEPDDDELTASDDERPRGWAVRREYRSTFRDTLTTSETLVAGQWWSTGRTRPDAADGGGPAGGATLGAGDGAAGTRTDLRAADAAAASDGVTNVAMASRRAAVVATRAGTGTGAANTLMMAGRPAETRAVDTGGVGDMPGGEVTAGTAENSGAAFLATEPPDIGTVVGGATVGGEAAGDGAASAGAAGDGAASAGAAGGEAASAGAAGGEAASAGAAGAGAAGNGATIPGAGAASTGAAGGEVAATRAADPGALGTATASGGVTGGGVTGGAAANSGAAAADGGAGTGTEATNTQAASRGVADTGAADTRAGDTQAGGEGPSGGVMSGTAADSGPAISATGVGVDAGAVSRTEDAPAASRRARVYEVSLEEEVATELGVGLGDEIVWDVQGVRIPTVITSLRRVDWARLEPNFFAVFEPAALAAAPQMWVFLARVEDATARAVIQRDVVVEHPNVSAIDLTLIQRALDDVIGRVSLVIRFLAAFSVATGFIVLLGAVATGRLQRIRESVLLKTLGATRRQIGSILFTEYALLGLLAVVVGTGLAVAAAWGLARFLFDVPFRIDPLPLLALAAVIGILSAAIGLSASREVFRSTPMEAIREE